VKVTVKIPGMTLYPGTGSHWWRSITSAQMVALSRRCDELGFDFITVSDHVVVDRASAPEMGSRWVHSLAGAGFLLGATSTIKVVPLVVAPYRNPVELAKAISSLDFLSGGRVTPCLLTGYKRSEFELLRAPYESRGEALEECVEAMRELWSSDRPQYHGELVEFDDIVFDPKPIQQPLPVWFGGRSRAALRRIARHGDGWISYATRRSEVPELLEFVRSQPAYARRPRPLDVWLELFEGRRDPETHAVIEQARVLFEPDAIVEQAREVAAAGATMTSLDDVLGIGKFQNDQPGAPPPTRDINEYLVRLEWIGEEILPAVHEIETLEEVR
jgi:probable F420-dependent oxidoreductase